MNGLSEDEAVSWAEIKTSGHEFTMPEFKKAQEAIHEERGMTPI